jgi:class 3 adenylate cyclase
MAIAMQRRMRELQGEWMNVGNEKPFQLRIGINTGFCTVGNFGSEDRMDYTIIGGEVNLAARLQAHAELGGILMAHETYSLVKDHIHAEELAPISVKGVSSPVKTYRVLHIHDEAEAETKIVRHQRPGARIDVDFRRLSAEDRLDVLRIAEELCQRLRDEQG